MKDMTQTEALAEAIRRWGPSGTIKFRPPLPARKQRGRLARYCCIVGNGIAGSFYSIAGQGNPWRAAFDDARPRRSDRFVWARGGPGPPLSDPRRRPPIAHRAGPRRREERVHVPQVGQPG